MKLKVDITNVVKEEEFDFNSSFLNDYIFSLRLNNIVSVVEKEYKDSMYSEVIKDYEGIQLICRTLKIKKRFTSDIPLIFLCGYIIEFLGFKKTLIKGICVKDVNGNKLKPEFEVFCRTSLLFTLPDVLTFSKDNIQPLVPFTAKTEVFFSCEILSSVLLGTSIVLRDSKSRYEIYSENGRCFIKYVEVDVPIGIDFLTDFSVNKQLEKHSSIRESHPVFNNFFNRRYENIVYNKRFYKTFYTCPQNVIKLVDFLENAPRFQDERDQKITELKNQLFDCGPLDLVQKYGYLEVFKYKQPKNKNKFSLQNFIDP